MNARLKLAMKFFLILSIAIAITVPIYATTFLYAFKCKSNDENSTMTHESRLQQSDGKDNGDTLGNMAGSFGYFQKGKIAFMDMIGYKEEKNNGLDVPRYHDYVGLFQDINISFEGAQGISGFHAVGSFPTKETITSKNVIRFEDFSRNFPQDLDTELSINHSAKNFKVNASSIMDNSQKENFSYSFLYDATVVKGVVETKRTMGVTDRTDLEGISLEQISFMKGNITVIDHFLSEKPS